MTLLVETNVPESGRLSLHIHADVQINISARAAQERATKFAHQKISSQMHGEMPILVLGDHAYWQVPIQLTFPSIGNAGTIGTLQVDVETGELNDSPALIEELEKNAEHLAARFAFTAAR